MGDPQLEEKDKAGFEALSNGDQAVEKGCFFTWFSQVSRTRNTYKDVLNQIQGGSLILISISWVSHRKYSRVLTIHIHWNSFFFFFYKNTI